MSFLVLLGAAIHLSIVQNLSSTECFGDHQCEERYGQLLWQREATLDLPAEGWIPNPYLKLFGK